jgi:hypothetical protein
MTLSGIQLDLYFPLRSFRQKKIFEVLQLSNVTA